MWVADHERILTEDLVDGCVGDHEGVRRADGHVAEGALACCLSLGETDERLAPLAIFVDQGDAHHGDVEDLLCETGDPVEALFAWCVEDVEGSQSSEPHRF